MKDYQICIISHNRHENVKEIFKAVGTEDIAFFVKDGKDVDNYRKNGVKLIFASGGLMESRNHAMQYCFDRGKICIELSDDLVRCERNDFTGKRTKEYVTALEVIEALIEDFKTRAELIAGFPPTGNPFFAMNEYDFNKFLVGDFLMIKPNNMRFDVGLKLKEDYDYCLQHMSNGTGCIRYGEYLNHFKHYSNKGGAVDVRTEELEQKTIQYLKDKWGLDIIKDNPKRPNEILLNRNAYNILNTNQTSLF